MQIILNGWIYSFIVCWIVFFLLVDLKTLKKNIWAGIVCSLLEFIQDAFAPWFDMFYVKKGVIYLLGTSAFFTFGVAFTMGILIMQFLPSNRYLQLVHILSFSVGFVFFEFLLVKYGLLVEVHWDYKISIFGNVIIMGAIAWLKQFVYKYEPKSI